MIYMNTLEHGDKHDLEIFKQITTQLKLCYFNLGSLNTHLFQVFSHFEYY